MKYVFSTESTASTGNVHVIFITLRICFLRRMYYAESVSADYGVTESQMKYKPITYGKTLRSSTSLVLEEVSQKLHNQADTFRARLSALPKILLLLSVYCALRFRDTLSLAVSGNLLTHL